MPHLGSRLGKGAVGVAWLLGVDVNNANGVLRKWNLVGLQFHFWSCNET